MFTIAFALGSGLAGLGGGLGIEVLGLDSAFPLKFMVYFLLVVVVGGAGTLRGPLLAAMILGVFDVSAKYYLPQAGAFDDLCGDGGVAPGVPRGTAGAPRMTPPPGPGLATGRWRWAEVVFWLVPLACFFIFPGYLVLASQVLIIGLFALSLDLVLGYAGILSLGHAAFFGLGAYTAGLLAAHGWGEPLSGLAAGIAVAAAGGFLTSVLVVRGEDLARLMVTLGVGAPALRGRQPRGVAHRRRGRALGRHDGQGARRLRVRPRRQHRFVYSSWCSSCCSSSRADW